TTSLSFPDPRAALLQGIASMQISETVSIRARQPKEAPNMPWGTGWGMAPPPVRKVGDRPGVLLGGWLFAVPKSAKNSELAWKSMDWLNSEINDYTNARRFELTPRYKANWAKDPFRSDSYDQALVKIARYGRRLPINLGMNGVLVSLGLYIQKELNCEVAIVIDLLDTARLYMTSIETHDR